MNSLKLQALNILLFSNSSFVFIQVQQLRLRLQGLGLDTKGKKSDLINRLAPSLVSTEPRLPAPAPGLPPAPGLAAVPEADLPNLPDLPKHATFAERVQQYSPAQWLTLWQKHIPWMRHFIFERWIPLLQSLFHDKQPLTTLPEIWAFFQKVSSYHHRTKVHFN